MPIPPIIFTPKPRVHRKRRPASVVPLMLISVAWDTDEGLLSLVFNRAIEITHLNAAAIRLKDGITTQMVLKPYPPVAVHDLNTFVMGVDDDVPFTDPVVLLNVAPGNGIVAVDDGTMWAGCTDLQVPWP